MGKLLDFLGWPTDAVEQRAPAYSLEANNSSFLQVLNSGSVSLPSVSIDSALTVPAVWAAVTFLSRTLAALPLHAYRNTKDGPERITGGLQTLIREAPNPEWTSFKLRQHFWQQVFTGGRGLLWIERSGSNIIGIWPINTSDVEIKRDSKGKSTYKIGANTYPASDVIDVPFALKVDGVGHWGPIERGAKAIQLALAMNDFGSSFFAGGGVPPLAVYGPLPVGPEAMKRATSDIQRAIDAAKQDSKPIVAMPPGYELKPIGFDPDKGQMTDSRRFQIEEIARLYNLPPVFLQDLSRATFSNSEQQDLHLVKHLVGQWAQSFEEECNLKLFGQRNGGRYVEHNLDGLLRGDFKTRADAVASLVQCGVYTPNIGAKYMGQTPHADPAADQLYMQGATLPLGSQPGETAPTDIEDQSA